MPASLPSSISSSSAVAATYFTTPRPVYELYDLDADPSELTNLSGKPELASQWQAYADVHTQIRELDDGGQWDKAVAKATGSGKDSSNTVFGTFDSNLASYLDGVSMDASNSLADEQPIMIVAAILVLLGGVAVALLGRWGVSERLKEYR